MPIQDGKIVDWFHKLVNFKQQVLELDREEEFTSEELHVKTALFWNILKSPRNIKVMEDFIEEYECLFPADTVNSVEEFDELMEALYDYCDYNLIWVG